MTSDKQTRANRRNALKSTGPTTPWVSSFSFRLISFRLTFTRDGEADVPVVRGSAFSGVIDVI